MGRNFFAACHRCKTKEFFFRQKESKPMHDFWRRHSECLRRDSTACEIRADGYGEQDWMNDYTDDNEGELCSQNKCQRKSEVISI